MHNGLKPGIVFQQRWLPTFLLWFLVVFWSLLCVCIIIIIHPCGLGSSSWWSSSFFKFWRLLWIVQLPPPAAYLIQHMQCVPVVLRYVTSSLSSGMSNFWVLGCQEWHRFASAKTFQPCHPFDWQRMVAIQGQAPIPTKTPLKTYSNKVCVWTPQW